MKRASIIIHDGYTDCEFLVAYHMLKAENFDVGVYSINGGPVVGIQGWRHKQSIKMTPVNGGDIVSSALLVLIGGVKAIEYLRQEAMISWWIQERAKNHWPIASICHGAQLLIEADVIKGAVISGYYSIKKDIENAGATYSKELCLFDPFITAPHYDVTGQWMKKAIYECQRSQRFETGDSAKRQG